MDGEASRRDRLERKIATVMERILEEWQYFLSTYTDIELKSKSSLLISLIVAIVGLGLMIYVLSLPPFLPGTI